MSESTLLDLDSLLDETLNDVEDLPDYITPPTGLYVLSIPSVKLEPFEKKDENGKVAEKLVRIRLTYSADECKEVEEGQYPPAAGSLFSDSFMFNEMGKAIFKRTAKAILNVDSLDDAPFREIFDALVAVEPFNASVVTKKKGNYDNTTVRPMHDEV